MAKERHTSDPDASWNRPRHARARKNRRKWCRGKVGVPHTPVVVFDVYWGRECHPLRWLDPVGWFCGHIVQCEVCGKKLEKVAHQDCPVYIAGEVS